MINRLSDSKFFNFVNKKYNYNQTFQKLKFDEYKLPDNVIMDRLSSFKGYKYPFVDGVIDAVKQATAVIKENKVDVEEFENVKEQMEEAKADQEELNDFFKDYADQNEEDIEDDLKDLEAEIIKEETKNLPSAVKTQLDGEKVKTKNEEKALEEFLI